MIVVVIVLSVVAVVVAMDLTIKRVYRYTKKPHDKSPAEFGIPYHQIRIPTRNKRSLYGWLILARGIASSRANQTVILVHGWGRNLERMLPYVQALHPIGYRLLAFDLRSHGNSDPDEYPNMLKFSEDIRAAVDYLVGQGAEPSVNVGVLGLSVGGGAAIHAASTDERISAVVTVGALAHPVDVMRSEFGKRHLPYMPVGWLLLKYLQLRVRVNFNRIAPVNVIQRAAAKIFLIHGDRDTIIPVQDAERLLRSANPEAAQLWVVPDRGHSDCHEHPDFWQRVGNFLTKAFTDH